MEIIILIIESGYVLPKILVDGIVQLKVKSFWIKEERKKHLLKSKVKWIITNSLTLNKYERISNCTTVKEVGDTLGVTYIGITQVKASKIHVLISQYETSKMEERKHIKDFV